MGMEKMKTEFALRNARTGKMDGITRLRISRKTRALLTIGANAYAMPRQDATATNVYSLSLPVLAVWSQ